MPDDRTNPYSSTNMKTGVEIVLFLSKTASAVLTVFTRRRLGTRYLDSWAIAFAVLYIIVVGGIFSGGASIAASHEVASMRADKSAFVWLVQLKNALQGKLIVPFGILFLVAVAFHKLDFWILELRGQYRHSNRQGDPHPPIAAVCKLILRPVHAVFLALAKKFKNPDDSLEEIGMTFEHWSHRRILVYAEPVLYVAASLLISLLDRGLGGFLLFSAFMFMIFNQVQFTVERKEWYDRLDAGEKQRIDALEAKGNKVEDHYKDHLPDHPVLRQRYSQQAAYERTSVAEALANLDPKLLSLMSMEQENQ